MRDKSISDDYIDLSGLTAEEREEFSRISDPAIVRGFGEFSMIGGSNSPQGSQSAPWHLLKSALRSAPAFENLFQFGDLQ